MNAILGTSTFVQREIMENLNVYCNHTERKRLSTLLGKPVSQAQPHDIYDANFVKQRVRFRDIIERYGDGVIKALLYFLKSFPNDKLCIIGNGGAGVSGLVYMIANQTELLDLTLVWHGGNSDVNFKNAFALHIGLTYEPHIERRFVRELGGNVDDIRTVFVNNLRLFIPKGDPLDVRTFVRTCRDAGTDGHGCIGRAIVQHLTRTSDSEIQHVYASRTNHSAIGEHDRIIFTRAASSYASHVSLGLGVRNPVSRFVHILYDTIIVRNQTWYPPSILEHCIEHGLYHINDVSFLNAKLCNGEISLDNILGDVVLDNPCQLWRNNMYSSRAADRVRHYMISDSKWLTRFNRYLSKSSPYDAVRAPTGTEISEYLKLQHEMQADMESYLQHWTFLNYEASVFAEVVSRSDNLDVSSRTFREVLNSDMRNA